MHLEKWPVPVEERAVRVEQSAARHAAPLLLLLSLLAAACAGSSSLAPRSGVTLLVINGTCASGACQSLDMLAFPSNGPVTPGGLWSLHLGTSAASQICVAIPASATFTVSGPTSTSVTRWTNAMPLSLGLVPPGQSAFQAVPSTAPFVPATAQGWTVTLPDTAAPIPSGPCKP
ncbi:MAG: hypothetical protein KGL38_02255 [Gemmatimonadota bacterium]|nr:hypothetical protein [Gemmatimonadota bacterium]MDE3216115.1 hypothetical protein [Gemmatimonadota bacterium]